MFNTSGVDVHPQMCVKVRIFHIFSFREIQFNPFFEELLMIIFCLFVFYSFLYKTNTIFPAFTRMVSQNSTYIISTYKSPLLTCMFSLHLQKNLVGKQILEQEGRAWWYISPPLPRGTFQLSSVFLLIVDAHLWDQSTL